METETYWNSTTAKQKMLKVGQRVMTCADEVPRTANEIAQAVVLKYGGNMETARKQAMFLASAKSGLLMEAGFRRCSVTKCEARTFVVRNQQTLNMYSQK
jgi:hypothetical protein